MKLPKYITAHCQAKTVKYNDREYSVQIDRNRFRYIKVSHEGKRKVIAIKDEVPDIIFDYIFNGKFKTNPNPTLSMCAFLRGKENQKKIFEINKSRFQINEDFEKFQTNAIQLTKKFKNEYIRTTPQNCGFCKPV